MSYDIHIKRDRAITLDEWKSAVDSTQDVRLDTKGLSITNPQTGDVITVAGMEGDAHINVEGTWHFCFRWRPRGSVAFKAPGNFDDAESPVRRVAMELARKLGARLIGDGGEEYD
jgi:hypothetical protein